MASYKEISISPIFYHKIGVDRRNTCISTLMYSIAFQSFTSLLIHKQIYSQKINPHKENKDGKERTICCTLYYFRVKHLGDKCSLIGKR